jgi:hypothetical protein
MTNKELVKHCLMDWLGDNIYDLNKYKFSRLMNPTVKPTKSKKYFEIKKLKRPTHW